MSVLGKLEQEQQGSEISTDLTSRLDAVEEQVRELTKSVNSVSGYVKAMDEAQTAALKRVERSISQEHEQPSKTQPDDETKSRLNEIEKTLSVIAGQLSASEAVKLPDGSKVKASDLDAHTMMQQIVSSQTTMTTALDNLTKEVHAKSHVKLDGKTTGKWLAKDVNEHFDQAIQKTVDGIRSDLGGFRGEMATLGAERLSEVRRAIDEGVSYLNDARQDIEKIERRVTFVGISRLALAVLPLFASLLLVGSLVWGFGSMVGIGPLFGWAWGAFTAASLWWQKALIAAATLSAAVLFVWAVLKMSRWVYEELR